MTDRDLIKKIGTKVLMQKFNRTKGAISYWRVHGIPEYPRMILEMTYPELFVKDNESTDSKQSESTNTTLSHEITP